ncbi:hypothetical protein [Desulfovibrio sp.]|nr:hypothetical protein [Desulfovibrio sp.]MDE7240489.1 hypothetical protein [Desulfovibrio sp.]
MRPIPKMLLLFALIILGSAIFFVVINDEDIGSPQTATQTSGAAGR